MLTVKRKREDNITVAPLQEVSTKKQSSTRKNSTAIGVRKQGQYTYSISNAEENHFSSDLCINFSIDRNLFTSLKFTREILQF